ncbi:ABC transporter permease [candidate division CSSED10-310 bacterium]|uniref:ABC transporter permease n=1 Tax=candidate division CSSED10-310 bacterium TaxID=2855610 RepID=A0ABV6YT47_UNCC1
MMPGAMRTLRALLLKELRQHISTLLVLIGVLLFGLILLVINDESQPRLVTILESLVDCMIIIIPIACFILSHRLVVTEYFNQTHKFLETIPIRRWQQVTAKYTLGSITILVMTVFFLMIVLWLSRKDVQMDVQFFWILLVKCVVFVYCTWSFFFAMGYTGKYRLPIFFGLITGIAIISTATGLDPNEYGPLSLVNKSTILFERSELPLLRIFETMLIGSLWLTIAYLLALIRNGSLAESLATTISRQEKAAIAILFIILFICYSELKSRKPGEPYEFTADKVLRSDETPLAILYGSEEVFDAANVLRSNLDPLLLHLKETLDFEELPPIRIMYRSGLDNDIFERGKLNDKAGILIRANFQTASTWQFTPFAAVVVHDVIGVHNYGRAFFEPKEWFVDGFSRWWAEHSHDLGKDYSPVEQLLERARVGTYQTRFTAQEIRSWDLYEENVGEAISDAVAYSGVVYMEKRYGHEAILKLARVLLGRKPYRDVRETFYEYTHSMPALFEKVCGQKWNVFIQAWSAWLDNQSRDFSTNRSASLHLPHPSFDIKPGAGPQVDIHYTFQFEDPLGPDIICSLLHCSLDPADTEIEPQRILREEHICSPDENNQHFAFHLPGVYRKGERAFFAFEIEGGDLPCPVRLSSFRMEIE